MKAPATFIKKPVEVQAMQWTGSNSKQLVDWTDMQFLPIKPGFALNPEHTGELFVAANNQWLGLVTGEWVLKDRHGFYPCKPDVFAATYESTE